MSIQGDFGSIYPETFLYMYTRSAGSSIFKKLKVAIFTLYIDLKVLVARMITL